jgi:PD-(D/E)XK nuclease superfamily
MTDTTYDPDAPADTIVLEPEWSGQMATLLRQAIDASMSESDRSKWAESGHLGVSDIGTCHEYVRRMILGIPWVDEQDNFAAAFVGTAVGEHVERAFKALLGGDVEIQRKVTVHLRVRGYDLDLPGTADIILTDKGLLDVKTKDGLGVVRRTGLTQQQVFQLVLYTAALIQEGVLELTDTGPMVGCAFVDRSGREPDPFVFGFQYTEALFGDAIAWLDDVIYAIEQDEVARKDPPRQWCFATCPYASDCRGGDTDVEGLLVDPEVVEAARIYRESNDLIKAAEKDKKSALSVLDGLSGSTGEFTVRWIDIPGGPVSFQRNGYKRIDIRPVKRGKS